MRWWVVPGVVVLGQPVFQCCGSVVFGVVEDEVGSVTEFFPGVVGKDQDRVVDCSGFGSGDGFVVLLVGQAEVFAEIFGPGQGTVARCGTCPFSPDRSVLGVSGFNEVRSDLEGCSVGAAGLFLAALGCFSGESWKVCAEFSEVETEFSEVSSGDLNIDTRACEGSKSGGFDACIPAVEYLCSEVLAVLFGSFVGDDGVDVDVPAVGSVGDFDGFGPTCDLIPGLETFPGGSGGHSVPSCADGVPD